MEEKRFLTIHDASRLWHIEAEELRRRCAEGRIKGAKQVRRHLADPAVEDCRAAGSPAIKSASGKNTDCRKNDGFSTA